MTERVLKLESYRARKWATDQLLDPRAKPFEVGFHGVGGRSKPNLESMAHESVQGQLKAGLCDLMSLASGKLSYSLTGVEDGDYFAEEEGVWDGAEVA